MGYYTRYELMVTDAEDFLLVIGQLRAQSDSAKYALQEDGSSSDEPQKWYEHEEDLREFSQRYPNLVFKLSGQGDDSEDMWDKYFQDGKMQVCKAEIVKKQFDPSQLK